MAQENESLLEYVQSLTVCDRECYLKKLTLTNGTRLADPYSLTQWMDDVTELPTVEWPDIYTHLIEKPSVYIKEKLRACRSLDAYNYVISGHVQNLEYKDLNDEFCFV